MNKKSQSIVILKGRTTPRNNKTTTSLNDTSKPRTVTAWLLKHKEKEKIVKVIKHYKTAILISGKLILNKKF